MGWFDGLDHYGITKPLTFVSWDDYVGSGHFDPDWNGLMHDLMRGLKRENFWVIETQPGNVNWTPLNNSLNKGEVRREKLPANTNRERNLDAANRTTATKYR